MTISSGHEIRLYSYTPRVWGTHKLTTIKDTNTQHMGNLSSCPYYLSDTITLYITASIVTPKS